MNERIKQLALDAGAEYTITKVMFLTGDEDLEKFAELIVRECADIARKNNNSGEGGVIAESIEEYFKIKGEVK